MFVGGIKYVLVLYIVGFGFINGLFIVGCICFVGCCGFFCKGCLNDLGWMWLVVEFMLFKKKYVINVIGIVVININGFMDLCEKVISMFK